MGEPWTMDSSLVHVDFGSLLTTHFLFCDADGRINRCPGRLAFDIQCLPWVSL
jgi:hypothetical protein